MASFQLAKGNKDLLIPFIFKNWYGNNQQSDSATPGIIIKPFQFDPMEIFLLYQCQIGDVEGAT